MSRKWLGMVSEDQRWSENDFPKAEVAGNRIPRVHWGQMFRRNQKYSRIRYPSVAEVANKLRMHRGSTRTAELRYCPIPGQSTDRSG